MKFYPRLKVFKNSPGTNEFDGRTARSYNWFAYARVLSDGRIILTENHYSPTTGQHVSDFHGLIDSDKIAGQVLAPRGLTNLADARNAIAAEIQKLETELQSKRIRNRVGRLDRIEKLKGQLPLLDLLDKDFSQSEAN